jgi:hypothetical protein
MFGTSIGDSSQKLGDRSTTGVNLDLSDQYFPTRNLATAAWRIESKSLAKRQAITAGGEVL